ncbi:MAG: hypothetical protein AAFZ01_03195 [Pseudomonadota bacterium]
MHTLAATLLLFGFGSFGLQFFDVQLEALGWMDQWGVEIGWGLRAGFIVVGALTLLWAQRLADARRQERVERSDRSAT